MEIVLFIIFIISALSFLAEGDRTDSAIVLSTCLILQVVIKYFT
ncbi:hypothetical protein ACWOAH_10395 [Vagococcus vulneris]|nr:hypothetical protein [Vagococcus vulneris]